MATIAFELASEDKPLIIVPVEVEDRGPFDFILDTGASQCVLSRELAEALEIQGEDSKEGKGCGCDAASASVSLSMGTVAKMQVGPVAQDDVKVAIMDMNHLREAIGRDLDGILGYNFLRKYLIRIDYTNRQLSFEWEPKGDKGSLRHEPTPANRDLEMEV